MIKVGSIYKHYKKKTKYLVLALATHSETLEQSVVYVALYDNEKSQVWVRPAIMWEELVENEESVKVPRFELIREQL